MTSPDTFRKTFENEKTKKLLQVPDFGWKLLGSLSYFLPDSPLHWAVAGEHLHIANLLVSPSIFYLFSAHNGICEYVKGSKVKFNEMVAHVR